MIEANIPKHTLIEQTSFKSTPRVAQEARIWIEAKLPPVIDPTANTLPDVDAHVLWVSEAVTNAYRHVKPKKIFRVLPVPERLRHKDIIVGFGLVTEPEQERGNVLLLVGDQRADVGPSNPYAVESGRGGAIMEALATTAYTVQTTNERPTLKIHKKITLKYLPKKLYGANL